MERSREFPRRAKKLSIHNYFLTSSYLGGTEIKAPSSQGTVVANSADKKLQYQAIIEVVVVLLPLVLLQKKLN